MYLAILTEKIVLNSFLWERFDVYIIEKTLPEGSVPWVYWNKLTTDEQEKGILFLKLKITFIYLLFII